MESVNPLAGWRYLKVLQCPTTKADALYGNFGVCMHSSLSVEAVCRAPGGVKRGPSCPLTPGWETFYASREHTAPEWECNCGYYALKRTAPEQYNQNAAAWCQMIGHTIEAEHGYRTTQVRLLGLFVAYQYPDYLLNAITAIARNLDVPLAKPDDAAALLRYLDVGGNPNPYNLAQYEPTWED